MNNIKINASSKNLVKTITIDEKLLLINRWNLQIKAVSFFLLRALKCTYHFGASKNLIYEVYWTFEDLMAVGNQAQIIDCMLNQLELLDYSGLCF